MKIIQSSNAWIGFLLVSLDSGGDFCPRSLTKGEGASAELFFYPLKVVIIICELPIGILLRILELMPIKYAARTSTLSKHWRHIWSTQLHLVFDTLFFHYISNIGVSAASNHGIQKITLDMANDENYLSKCIFSCHIVPKFPILLAIQLEHFEIAVHRETEDTLNLPMLETLELRFCVDVDSISLVYSKHENLSILSSYTITFE
ncbi:hypothetical protein H5410_027223 [Solanum commersonii]|uniref:F-box domain-containing protein n=1 Tax=Solanum commersonii TaxID=4109 RepID=A0A9J5YYH0_SOLCO|nr:hypothetical protein H5410_027223 [Solanum commersonii]